MKSVFYGTIILPFFLLVFALPCSADEVNLGTFSAQQSGAIMTNGLAVSINGESFTFPASEVASWLKERSALSYVPDYRSEIENSRLCPSDTALACRLSFDYRREGTARKDSSLTLDTEALKKSLSDLADKADKDPVNAHFKLEDNKVSAFSLSEKGLALDQDKSLGVIIDYLKQKGFANETKIELPYTETDPAVTEGSINNLGIDTLLGEGHSNFRGSPKNRVFNINVATARFDGLLIRPGEEFSFVSVLGEVDGEHGYLPELVIKKDRTEPEFGGGICQVSTTAFRAAIYSGLEITARRNHAYPVSYYNPQGMDSTVYVPKPDLRFKNDTPGYILIQTKIVGTELTFQFYGTSDGRQTNVIGPTILERNADGSMKTTFTQQVFDKDNNLVREDVFNSNYESPSKFPHPGETSGLLTKKPKNWSDHEWRVYKQEHGMT